MTKLFLIDFLIGNGLDFQISIISLFMGASMEQLISWLNIIKLGKSAVIRRLQSLGLVIKVHAQDWKLCSLFQVGQTKRFEQLMSECDLVFQEAEAVLASAQKHIEDLKQN